MDYTKYLDYTLNALSENYEKGLILDDLRKKYNKLTEDKIPRENQRHFENLYEYKYFARVGNSFLHRITPETKELIDKHGSFLAYLDSLKEEQDENNRIQKIQIKKLEDDAKLSDLQVKVFPYVFIAGLIGGIYSIVSILFLLFGESTEEKIQRILESKSKSKPKIENISTSNKNLEKETLKK